VGLLPVNEWVGQDVAYRRMGMATHSLSPPVGMLQTGMDKSYEVSDGTRHKDMWSKSVDAWSVECSVDKPCKTM